MYYFPIVLISHCLSISFPPFCTSIFHSLLSPALHPLPAFIQWGRTRGSVCWSLHRTRWTTTGLYFFSLQTPSILPPVSLLLYLKFTSSSPLVFFPQSYLKFISRFSSVSSSLSGCASSSFFSFPLVFIFHFPFPVFMSVSLWSVSFSSSDPPVYLRLSFSFSSSLIHFHFPFSFVLAFPLTFHYLTFFFRSPSSFPFSFSSSLPPVALLFPFSLSHISIQFFYFFPIAVKWNEE